VACLEKACKKRAFERALKGAAVGAELKERLAQACRVWAAMC
jgi:predicted RNA-binding protein YlxR (DUF448 family)